MTGTPFDLMEIHQLRDLSVSATSSKKASSRQATAGAVITSRTVGPSLSANSYGEEVAHRNNAERHLADEEVRRSVECLLDASVSVSSVSREARGPKWLQAFGFRSLNDLLGDESSQSRRDSHSAMASRDI